MHVDLHVFLTPFLCCSALAYLTALNKTARVILRGKMIGELAALGSAVSWTVSAMLYGKALQREKPISANIVRLACTSPFLLILLGIAAWSGDLGNLSLNHCPRRRQWNNRARSGRHALHGEPEADGRLPRSPYNLHVSIIQYPVGGTLIGEKLTFFRVLGALSSFQVFGS